MNILMNSFEETESLCFQSDDNIIKKILDNKSDYTELRIENKHKTHFKHNKSEYLKLYGQRTESLCSRSNDFILLIMNAMTKNEYIDSLYIDHGGTDKLLFIKMFRSIYIKSYSLEVLRYLNTHKNKVEKLQLSSIAFDEFKKIPETCKLLKSLDISSTYIDNTYLHIIFGIINKTNITELILDIDYRGEKDIETYKMFISTNKNLKNLHFKRGFDKFHLNNFVVDIIFDNYTLLNVTINGKCYDEVTNIMNRNKKYMMTILLCMNKKIIPRCVFKSMILVHVI